MAIQTPPAAPTGPDEDVEAGVIKDARARQRKQWGGALALLALGALSGGLILGFSGGGGGSGSGRGGGHGPDGGKAAVPHATMSAPKPSVLAAAIRRCDRQPAARGGTGARTVAKGAFSDDLALSAVGGGYVGLVSNAGGSQTYCVTAVQPSPYKPTGGGHGVGTVAPGAGKLSSAGMGGFGGLAGSISYDFGRAGRDVSAIEYVFLHRRAVEARIENGWYIALWPGDARNNQPTSVRVKTSSGTVTSPPPGRQCSRKPSTCVFVSVQLLMHN